MNTLEIPKKNIKIEYPSSWDEHTPDQHAFIMKQVVALENNKINAFEFKLIILYHFLNAERSPFAELRERRMKPEQLEEKFGNIYLLTETLDYLFRTEKINHKPCMVLDYTSVKNYMPTIESMHGPADALLDVTFGEYRAAFDAFREKKMDRLTAILYRPIRKDYNEVSASPEYNGQKREKFNVHLVDEREKEMSQLPLFMKYAIYLFFRNCDMYIKTGQIEVHGNMINLGVIFNQKSGGSSAGGLGLTGTLYRLADAGTFGSIKETDETALYDILLKLYQYKIDMDEFDRKNKKK